MNYFIVDFLRTLKNFVVTKIFYKNARLIRQPFYLRGKKNISWGENFTTGYGCRIESFAQTDNAVEEILKIGKNCQINDFVHIAAIKKIIIGDNVLIASKVFISDHNHGNYSSEIHSSPDINPQERKLYSNPIKIEDNVWIGESVSILPGVTIGRGTIIGANTTVTKNIPEECIVVGNPGKIIKKFNRKSLKWEKYENHNN